MGLQVTDFSIILIANLSDTSVETCSAKLRAHEHLDEIGPHFNWLFPMTHDDRLFTRRLLAGDEPTVVWPFAARWNRLRHARRAWDS